MASLRSNETGKGLRGIAARLLIPLSRYIGKLCGSTHPSLSWMSFFLLPLHSSGISSGRLPFPTLLSDSLRLPHHLHPTNCDDRPARIVSRNGYFRP